MAILDKLSLFNYLLDNKELEALNEHEEVHVSSPEALALLTALSYQQNPRKLFFLFPTIYEAQAFSQFLNNYVKEDESFLFPYDEIFRNSAIGASLEMHDERALAISSIFSNKPSILVSHLSAASLVITSPDKYKSGIITINDNDFIDRDKLIDSLVHTGYTPIDRITTPGQFSLRGGILDIFDPSYSDPVRIEFFGDEIDDLRFFKVKDELSFEHIKKIIIHPFSLNLFDENQYREGREKILKELNDIEATDRLSLDDLKERVTQLLTDAEKHYLTDINQRFYSFFNNEEKTLLSYVKDYERYIYEPSLILETYKDLKSKEKSYFKKVVKSNNSLRGEKVYAVLPPDFKGFQKACNKPDDSFSVRDNSYKAISYAQSDKLFQQYLDDNYKVRVVLPEPNLTNCENYLTTHNFSYSVYPKHSEIMFLEGSIAKGFEVPDYKHVYLSAKEIYGVNNTKSRFLTRYKEAKVIRKYEDLKEGDYVVHEVHGVGKYLGVTTMDGLEYLKIKYADDAIFYLPLSQYRLIRKYSSREGYAPTLDKIGGSTWSRKKARIRSKISYLADQLLTLYSERSLKPGFAFPKEDQLEEEYINSFPYQYTSSQLAAMKDVKADMESPHPMDRLIAGDVGFGKTEIALFAAFKAVLGHKQVALLCPTTILCQQHFKVAKQRLEPFGIRIASFSRFVPKKEQQANIKLLEEGKIDLVIGTHRLLSDEIKFKDLGLLIIDEEQKFGVTHKEKIKERSKNIDCLTLTATPIPRTMQMSLLNVRALSLLEEPPVNRLPVKTYVAKMDKELIDEVIEKELTRKGQVYYLHNKISTLQSVADRLAKKFPDAIIKTVHARMNEDEIEETMADFYEGRIDVLVCTSIIESGLDIPNVNTIIVEDADHFGLAQLYQIKGRVGRSDRLAYAYFFFKSEGKLTDEARKRLKALKDFTELGSGYKIAMQDLNIRGAGDILGSEQAGFVDTLGYDAYMELLQEVVKEKKTVSDALKDKEQNYRFELSFSLDAHIPEQYGSESQRINMYRELSDCTTHEELVAYSYKLKDIYGEYPEEVSNLIIKREIEINLNSNLYDNFVEGLGIYTITTSKEFSSQPLMYKRLEEALKDLVIKLRVKISNNRFEFVLTKTKDYLMDLLSLTETIKNLYQNR